MRDESHKTIIEFRFIQTWQKLKVSSMVGFVSGLDCRTMGL